jgi:hypothetical protein
MSLQVRDPRSRGRDKSPSGRDRDRSHSRDARAPSPPEEKRRKSSSKKYYDDDSEEEKVKYIETAPSKKSSKKYYDESSEDDRRTKSSKKHYDSDEDDRKPKSSSKKYYEPDSEEEDRRRKSRYESESDESPRHRSSKNSSTKKHYDDDSGSDDPRYKTAKPLKPSQSHAPEPPGAFPSSNQYQPQPGYHPSYSQPDKYKHGNPADYMGTRHMSYVKTQPDGWAEIPECERPGFVPPPQFGQQGYTSPTNPRPSDKNLSNPGGYPPSIGSQISPLPGYAQPIQPQYSAQPQYQGQQPPFGQQPYYGQSPTHYGPHTDIPDHQRIHSISAPSGHGYAQPSKYEYAQPDPNIKYAAKGERKYSQSSEPQFDKHTQGTKAYTQSSAPQYVEIRPGGKSDAGLSSGLQRLSVSGGAAGLTVATAGLAGGGGGGAKPPGSPLLEAYRGTYQSISPMPSPIMGAHKHDSDLSDLDLDSDDSHHGKKKKSSNDKDSKSKSSKNDSSKHDSKHDPRVTVISPTTSRSGGPKRVSFYDPTSDAKILAAALSAKTPDPGPIIRILPHLSTDDILALRAEYKNHAKMSGKGINVAKHIKLKVPGNLGKAAYATALGRWESEAYWANCWYQGGASRRELLIESLMGRSNSDIREIKAAFSDKRYSDSLEKCMKSELKADKFRTAILLALEEKRQPESSPLSLDLVRRDIQDLHRALMSRDGGETAMINIIVLRSDTHLREVLRGYEMSYKKNFAREMIAKSRNLVVR